MKVVAVVAVAVLFGSLAAEAAPRRSSPTTSPSYSAPAKGSSGGQRMAGCGLGSQVVETNDKWSQVGAAFLNGTGMQTFGISFGTSNCTEDGVAMAAREKDAFVEANLADLRRDLAVGEGEYLSSLAGFYGCEGDAARVFGLGLQQSGTRLMDVSAEEASSAIDGVVKAERLSCQG